MQLIRRLIEAVRVWLFGRRNVRRGSRLPPWFWRRMGGL